MPNSNKEGKENELKVKRRYEKLGYQVFRVGERGFPDLIAIKDGKVEFLAEVKGGSHSVHSHQKRIHEELGKMGFQVKIERV